MSANSGAKNVQLQEVTCDQRNWESENGILRRDTIDSMVVKNLSITQEDQNHDISKTNKALIWIKRIALVLICTVVAGGFSAPIVIYYTEADRGVDNLIFAINLDIDNCQSINHSMLVSSFAINQ